MRTHCTDGTARWILSLTLNPIKPPMPTESSSLCLRSPEDPNLRKEEVDRLFDLVVEVEKEQ